MTRLEVQAAWKLSYYPMLKEWGGYLRPDDALRLMRLGARTNPHQYWCETVERLKEELCAGRV